MADSGYYDDNQVSLSKLLRGKDVAEILNVSIPFAYRMMRRGDIPTIRLGRSVRVRVEDLETFINDTLTRSV